MILRDWKKRHLLTLVLVSLLVVAFIGASTLETVYNESTAFAEVIDDLSDNSYIGVDEHGVLSLFEGPPLEDNIIRSFFQINIEFLESSLPPEIVEQLYEGIRITNHSEYNSVLSTFSDYAIENMF